MNKKIPNRFLLTGLLAWGAETVPLCAETFDWALNDSSPVGGNWNLTTAAGWVSPGTYPSAVGDIANVNKNIGANQTISINVANAKVRTLFLQDNQPTATDRWDISSSNGTNALTFEASSGNALLHIGRNANGANVISAPLVLNSNLEVRVAGNTSGLSITGVISGSSGIIKTEAYQLVLADGNTYQGTTTVNEGTLRITADSGLGTAPASATTGAITLNGGILNTHLSSGAITIHANRGITLGASGGTWFTSIPSGANTVTYNGVISGSGSLTKTGNNTLSLGGNNTFTGGMIISAGTILIDSADALNSSNPNTVAMTSGILRLNGNSVTIAGLSGAGGNVQNANDNPATLTVNRAAGSQTFSGTLADGTGIGPLSFNKDGGGTLILAGNNTYTGTTTVSAGTLLVTGALGDTVVNVESGATIGGDGSIDGGLTITSGGNLRLDATLTVTGGTVNFGGFGIGNLVGFNDTTPNGTYTLIGGGADFVFDNITNLGPENAYSFDGGRSAYFQQGSLQLVVIPESSAALFGGLGLLALLRRRR